MDFERAMQEANRKIIDLNIDQRNIIIWGMGYVSKLYENAFKNEKIKIYAYTGKEAVEGEYYNGYPMIKPEKIVDVKNPLVIIGVHNRKHVEEIKRQIEKWEAKIEYLLVDEFFFAKNVQIILDNIQALEDDKSKRIYQSLIERRVRAEMKMYDLFEENQYFALPAFRKDDDDEVFVDVGGFVGDTLEKYLFVKLAIFKKYYVFEPDERNYKALSKRISRLSEEWNLDSDKVIPIFAGVGEKDGKYYFEEASQSSSGSHFTQESNGAKREVVTLDSYFKDIKVSFIKADIESYEFNMLLGGREVIRRDRPKLAISIYHNAVDMYNIIDWIKGLKLGYKFYVRHHGVREAETVLYAICDD